MDEVTKDALAIVASLYRNDIAGYSVLMADYQSDPDKQAALAGSLAALAGGILRALDMSGLADGKSLLSAVAVTIAGDE